MGRIGVSIEIDAPVSAVWRVLEPIERHVDWMADAHAIRFESDQRRGVGTRFVCDTRVGPITIADRMEVTEWESERRMGVRHDGVVSGTGLFELEPIDLARRTRLTWTETLRFPWYLGGPIGEYLGGRWILRLIWQRNLTTLRRLVEDGQPRSARRRRPQFGRE